MIHRIGIISDTHGLLRPEIKELLKDCEMILHGGDINKQSVLDELADIAPVYAVRGNADKDWAGNIPETLSLRLYGINVLMIHNKQRLADTAEADVIIYGHSHKYDEKYLGSQLWLNPGSCGPRRFSLPITMAVLEIGDDGTLHVVKHDIPHKNPNAGKACDEKNPADAKGDRNISVPQNISQIIQDIIKDIGRGRSVKEIAGRNKIDERLAEEICRLYLTHPGVDADGIMTKMGL